MQKPQVKYTNIDEYIALFPPEIQKLLQQMRQTIKSVAPNAVEAISYGMPTFKLQGKNLVHFAAFTNHLGFFPTSSPIPAFAEELKQYKTSKGTIQLPLDKPLPLDLIKRIVEFRVNEILSRNQG